MSEIPAWFRGSNPKPDPLEAECPKCGAPAGERCRYLHGTNVHLADAGEVGLRYLENEIGQPMVRYHKERHRAREAM